MIIYNVTCSVDRDIAEEWLLWMKEEHIADLLSAGLFEEIKILKVLSHEDEATLSFAVQFSTSSIKNIEKYHANDAIEKRFGVRVLTYRTLLEEV